MATIKRDEWNDYFQAFSFRNQGRPTKLEIFGELGAQEEEHYLPLNGVSLAETGADVPRIEIMLGGESAKNIGHLMHMVPRVCWVTTKVSADGRDEAIEFEDAEGSKTLLQFEPVNHSLN